MPELPEVETIVRSVRPLIIGRRITGAEFRECESKSAVHPTLVRLLRDPREFRRRVEGALIVDVERYGKNVLVHLCAGAGDADPQDRHPGGDSRDLSLLIHLGMTGRLTCEGSPEFLGKHTHLVLGLDEPGRWVHYSDVRRFGRLRITDQPREELGRLGPDPLEITGQELVTLLRSRRAMLKSLLLDQHFLRGMGNIYADESLFRAGIHPASIAARLSRKRALRLYHGIRETLLQAIEQGGSSISDYVDAEGRRGNFQTLHQVYRRTGEPCLRCGSRIKKIIISSRSTHFCPRCQRR